MHHTSLEFLKCPKCNHSLDLDIFSENTEIEEALLECSKCNMIMPVINKIPIMCDIKQYFTERRTLGGRLYRTISNLHLKKFLKTSLHFKHENIDRTYVEDRWASIYQNQKTRFYSTVMRHLNSTFDMALEYGSSVGIMTQHLSDICNYSFGVDKSYSAVSLAKKSSMKNVEHIVTDFMSPIFDKTKFELVLALNILEFAEDKLLKHIASQMVPGGHFVISDPYDFDRNTYPVKNPPNPISLRQYLHKLGFVISSNTKNPSYLAWNLKIHSRASMNYRVDLIVSRYGQDV